MQRRIKETEVGKGTYLQQRCFTDDGRNEGACGTLLQSQASLAESRFPSSRSIASKNQELLMKPMTSKQRCSCSLVSIRILSDLCGNHPDPPGNRYRLRITDGEEFINLTAVSADTCRDDFVNVTLTGRVGSCPQMKLQISSIEDAIVDEVVLDFQPLVQLHLHRIELTTKVGLLELELRWHTADVGANYSEFEQEEKRRILKCVFNVTSAGGTMVSADQVLAVCRLHLERKGYSHRACVDSFMQELHAYAEMHNMPMASDEKNNTMPWATFEDIILPLQLSGNEASSKVSDEASCILKGCFDPEVSELVNRLAMESQGFDTSGSDSDVSNDTNMDRTYSVLCVFTLITNAVMLASVATLGSSIDHPDWPGWLVFDCLVCAAMTSEICLKLCIVGMRVFFSREQRLLNVLDVLLTKLALLDLAMTIFGIQSQWPMLIMTMRLFRLGRVARLVRMLNLPFFKEFADMVNGFVIAMPWLFWVFVILWSVVYLLALMMRLFIRLADDNSATRLSICGDPDFLSLNDEENPFDCEVHMVYAESRFKNTATAMFTVFSFMIGDTYTRAGRNLVAIFSEGYGVSFDFCFSSCMILTGVALSNIITALFVDSTLTGLKYTDTQRKYERLYEGQYVAKKLMELSERLIQLFPDLVAARRTSRIPAGLLTMNSQQFTQILRDSNTKAILADLDIQFDPRSFTFSSFAPQRDGLLRLEDFFTGLIRFRGEMRKSDMVSLFAAMKTMQHQLKDIELHVASVERQTAGTFDFVDEQSRRNPTASLS